MEEVVKKLDDHNCSILKTIVDTINSVLDKLDQGSIHGSRDRNKDQGPSKCTRANSKKIEVVKDKEIEELKAFVVNMNILAD